jgi:hypothetical protein
MSDENFVPPPKICKVCKRPLEFHIEKGTGETSWHHHNQDMLGGHKPIPVDAGESEVKGRCDFCNEEVTGDRWELPANDFVAGVNPLNGKMQGYAGAWSACAVCAQLVERNAWNRLLERVQETWEADHGIPAPEDKKTGWRVLYRLLRKNISGSLRKVE